MSVTEVSRRVFFFFFLNLDFVKLIRFVYKNMETKILRNEN